MVQKNIKLNKGFTIIELLVVIVVIGILAAISIVSYSGISNKARVNANKSTADSIKSAALTIYADTGTFPATNATAATALSNLNGTYSKITLPTGSKVSNATSTKNEEFSYRLNSAGTGICVGYWNPETPAAEYLFGGNATADNGTCT